MTLFDEQVAEFIDIGMQHNPEFFADAKAELEAEAALKDSFIDRVVRMTDLMAELSPRVDIHLAQEITDLAHEGVRAA